MTNLEAVKTAKKLMEEKMTKLEAELTRMLESCLALCSWPLPYQGGEKALYEQASELVERARTKKRAPTVFLKPTIEEVAAYCRERRNRVDPRLWYDHYEANGWRVGRNPMKNWKASVRTWEAQHGRVPSSEPGYLEARMAEAKAKREQEEKERAAAASPEEVRMRLGR